MRKIAPCQASIPGPTVLWVDAGMMGPHSTHGYNCIVVGFILTTNELLYLILCEECIAWCGGIRSPMAWYLPPLKVGESLTLKCWKCTKEKNLLSSRIDPGTNGPLGGCQNDPRLYLYIVVGFILTTNELLCLNLHEECIAWCGGIRKDAGLSITVGSLTLKCSKCNNEKNLPSSRIDPGTNGPLGGCWNDGAPQHPRL